LIVHDVPCPRCGADRGAHCTSRTGRQVKPGETHTERHEAFYERRQIHSRRTQL